MLLKLPASSGKTGAMRAKSGSRSGDLDISGGYETVKCRVNRARTRLSKLLSIDSADRFGQDHTTRAVLTAGGRG